MSEAKSLGLFAVAKSCGILTTALVLVAAFGSAALATDNQKKPETAKSCRAKNEKDVDACHTIPSWYKGGGIAKVIDDCLKHAATVYFDCLKSIKVTAPPPSKLQVAPTTEGSELEKRTCAKGSIACTPAVGNGIAP